MKDHDVIIGALKDDNEYYRGIGKNYLSNSDIGSLLSNPQQFGKPREDNKAFAEGRLFHQLLIEPDKAEFVPFVDVSTRTTKEYKAYCDTHNLPFALLKKELDDIHRLVSVIKANITFFDEIYREGNQYEVPSITEIHGMMWKGKADIVTPDSIIDLKTTGDIHKFKYSAKAYNYDSQCFIYQQLFGKPLVFFVIDKGTSQLGIFKPTQSFVDSGEQKVIRAIEVYNRFFSEEHWDDISNYYISENLD
jgi:hypothetical protein